PITMIVPFAAGGASDVIARLIAEQMSQTIGQRIVIENVVGAGGSTAMTRAARATADGYTIIIGNSGTATAVYALYPDLRFTPGDFAPIGIVAKTAPVIALKKDHVAKTLKDFIAYAKKNPGKATLGHAGVGSSNYLICKAFVQAAGIDVTLVSYRGGGPALNDLLAGQIDGVCDNAASAAPSIRSGLINGIVLGMPARLNSLPDVPTSAEAGLPDFLLQGWNGLFAPKSTPQPTLDKLNAALRKGVASDLYQKRLAELGALPPSDEEMSVAYLQKFVPSEIDKFKTLLTDKK
ncbi:MAG: tripartite tricarboxylate transporter substrate binding protein BugD, partial [Rhizobiales bacterium]|nr:tripartite tricarboxylate transporter substrate binding protein BugD [Hyphomicrobiales bacterium]